MCDLRRHTPPRGYQVSSLWRADPLLVANRSGAWLAIVGAIVGGLLIAVGWRRVTRRARSRDA